MAFFRSRLKRSKTEQTQETAHAPKATAKEQNLGDLPRPASLAPEALAAIAEIKGEASPSTLDVAPRTSTPPTRKRRTKTRLLGFEKSDGQIVDLFNTPVETDNQNTRFPVGWLVVSSGPGYGEAFVLHSGMSQIGRGDDQTVQLDFGDTAISRNNHAGIVYDTETHQFFLGHGGKSNIVRLNDKPVISNEILSSGDMIRIGETTLRFVALCDGTFNWDATEGEEDDDVEIA